MKAKAGSKALCPMFALVSGFGGSRAISVPQKKLRIQRAIERFHASQWHWLKLMREAMEGVILLIKLVHQQILHQQSCETQNLKGAYCTRGVSHR